MVEEFLRLALGVTTYDTLAQENFLLHAYLIAMFGDLPAVVMFMKMKGHNAIFPCRMCSIKAMRTSGPHGVYYVALKPPHDDNDDVATSLAGSSQSQGKLVEGGAQDVASSNDGHVSAEEEHISDLYHLLLQTHDEFLHQAQNVELAPSKAEAERRAKKCGIKGVPLLAHLPSMSLPQSFPLDFMHLVYKNLFKNLLLLWTANFKSVDHAKQPYVTKPTVWEAIGKATASAAKDIPSAFGPRMQNIAEERFQYTADALAFWHLYLGPVYLERHLF